MGRSVILGDIHGCYEEAVELIKETGYRKGKDDLYFIGDHVNKGPDSYGCFRLRKEQKARCLLGNHEEKFIKAAKGIISQGGFYHDMKREFGDEFEVFLEEISAFPCFIETEYFDLVHAGIKPFHNLRSTSKEDLITLREVSVGNKEEKQWVPWYDFYSEKKTVVFGHWAQLRGVIRKNVIGIDMGCVYGNQLRALILPQREIVEVEAKETYCPID